LKHLKQLNGKLIILIFCAQVCGLGSSTLLVLPEERAVLGPWHTHIDLYIHIFYTYTYRI